MAPLLAGESIRCHKGAIIGAITLLWLPCGARYADGAQRHDLSDAYIDPRYLTAVPFGAHSHWMQPWRAYQETIPAQRFLDAQGIVLDGEGSIHFDLVCQMLARHGIRHVRIEVGWNSVDWDRETRLNNVADLRNRLLACQKAHLRPLILLNANSGAPGPTRFFDRALATSAHKGDRQVELTDVRDLVVGYSGFRNLTDNRASEVLITGVNGNRVTLSRPLPKDLGEKGATVAMSTLKYRPFGPPETVEYRATLDGWQRYVGTVAHNVADILGTQGKADLGFDMEIWNELSFGSSFLTLNAYYEPRFAAYDEFSIWANLVKATVAVAEAHPEQFRGVRFVDGFRNTIPWPAASTEPLRVSAMSAHPYPPRKQYPLEEQSGRRINAMGEEDKSGFIPTYTADFPEYYGTLLQTESVLRDMGPIPSTVGNTLHGRNGRVANGTTVPCPLWFTEIGFAPNENGIPDKSAALTIKAKAAARTECFFIGKGLERIYFFSAFSGDNYLGIVQDNFVTYAKEHAAYPVDDAPYTSPMLRTLGRLVEMMKDGVDPTLTKTRAIAVEAITDSHDHLQFSGDGTPAHPPLYNRDVFTLLPFQVNAHKFVLAYYVMTRDVTKSLIPEQYTVRLKGLHGKGAALRAYDPVQGKTVPVVARTVSDSSLTVTLTATDYPCLLIVQEH
jgi:hypothetical protein